VSYTTLTDLRNRISDARLAQLTDFENTGSLDVGRVTDALAKASGIVDSYCSRYSLPLQATEQIKDLELTIAIYKLYEGRQAVPDQIRKSFEDAIAFLKDISAGRASLSQAAVPQSSRLDVGTRDHETDPYVFDDTRLEDY
jgi:phage gp36-like protein